MLIGASLTQVSRHTSQLACRCVLETWSALQPSVCIGHTHTHTHTQSTWLPVDTQVLIALQRAVAVQCALIDSPRQRTAAVQGNVAASPVQGDVAACLVHGNVAASSAHGDVAAAVQGDVAAAVQGDVAAAVQGDVAASSVQGVACSGCHATVLVLFSGGVDSTLIAALVHRALPRHLPIDLCCVCFDGGRSPDRLAALDALEVSSCSACVCVWGGRGLCVCMCLSVHLATEHMGPG